MKSKEQNNRTISQKLKEFNSLQRWEKTDSSLVANQEQDLNNIHNKEFLIRKYKSKFPDISSHQEQSDVIRL